MATSKQRHERAKEDARTSNEFGRAAAQAAILINGGAATALLAFFSAVIHDGGNIPKAIAPLLPATLATYALGVFLAAIALPIGSRSIENYMATHEGYNRSTVANRQWNVAIALIVCSLVCFVISSFWLARGLGVALRISN
jgi:hypothetical protein